MKNFQKIVMPSLCEIITRMESIRKYPSFVKVEYKDGRLSIHGVVGQLPSGNCRGSAGQCVDEIVNGSPAKGWTEEMLKQLCDIWNQWHLNDMRPYCEHQKRLGWDKKAKETVLVNGERKYLSWVLPKDHSEGLLTRECPICGYKYGTAWKTESVPESVLEWLIALPVTSVDPAWI